MAKPAIGIIVFTIILAYITNTIAFFEEDRNCPQTCYCELNNGFKITNCAGKNFTSIPYKTIHRNTKILDMHMNFISDLKPFSVKLQLWKLDLSQNNITTVKKSTFIGQKKLRAVSFASNKIKYVAPDTFINNSALATIYFNNNQLKQVNGPFLYSKSLLRLNLGYNYLTKLSNQFFTNFSRLEELDLTGNPLQIIESGTFDPIIYLKNLILNDCSLTHVSNDVFKNLKRLNKLKINGNNLKSNFNWNLIFVNLSRLEELELRKSGILDLPKMVFFNNTKLNRLVLAENDLSNLDVANTIGYSLVNLNFLDLSYNNLKKPLSKTSFANNKELHTLILSGNNLSSHNLAGALSPLLKLIDLSLKDCGLTKLPENTFSKITQLKKLDISRNPLNNTEFLTLLNSLINLDMAYCNLQYISKTTFSGMSALNTLILTGNKITNLEAQSFHNLQNLEILDLKNCGLNHWYFSNYYTNYNLKELRLSENYLEFFNKEQLPGKDLSSLLKLDISKCNLTSLPDDVFVTIPNLLKLQLNNNTLNNDKNDSLKFLKPLSQLTYLDLSFNNITSIKLDKFSYNYVLEAFKFDGNPWKCECYIIDWWSWARSVYDTDIIKNLLCNIEPNTLPLGANSTLPLNMQRTWLDYVTETQFQCPFPIKRIYLGE